MNYLRHLVTRKYESNDQTKERPGSIVTKTPKNEIFILIAASKESHFNAYFKYISFIKFSPTHQKLRDFFIDILRNRILT